MKTFIISAFFLFSGLSISPAQEITTSENMFTEHEVVWELAKEPLKMFYPISENYFGFIPHDGGVYRQFDKTGKLIWSTESLDFTPMYVDVSAKGNRILCMHYVKTQDDYWQTSIDIFDSLGTYLFPIINSSTSFWLKCSPHGDYYYCVPGEESYNPLMVFDETGKELFVRHGIGWDATALDDSLIAFTDSRTIEVIDVRTNNIVSKKPRKLIVGNSTVHYFLESSKDGEKLALWSSNKNNNNIYILDKSLNLMSQFSEDDRIRILTFSDDSDALGYAAFDYQQRQLDIRVLNPDGYIIDQLDNVLPRHKELANRINTMSFCLELMNINIILFDRKEKKKYEHSLVVQVDQNTKKIISSAFVPSKILAFENSCDLIEISDTNIKFWQKIGGDNE